MTKQDLEAASRLINARLFGGTLPPVIIRLSRLVKTLAFFAPARHRWGKPAEITFHPDALSLPPAEVMTKLVHEMCHHWQAVFGTPCHAYYHDREWAGKMVEIGLQPTATGKPGGKQTGQRVTQLIEEGGKFARVMATPTRGGNKDDLP